MSDQPSFTVVFAFGEGATLSVGESGNDFSAYRVIAIANGDYTERLNDAENQLAEARAENERLENLLAEGVHTCSPLCKRPMCVMRRRVEEQRDLMRAVVEEKERLSTYLGGPVAIDELNRRIRAMRTYLEDK